jgi:hypothetical protein
LAGRKLTRRKKMEEEKKKGTFVFVVNMGEGSWVKINDLEILKRFSKVSAIDLQLSFSRGNQPTIAEAALFTEAANAKGWQTGAKSEGYSVFQIQILNFGKQRSEAQEALSLAKEHFSLSPAEV